MTIWDEPWSLALDSRFEEPPFETLAWADDGALLEVEVTLSFRGQPVLVLHAVRPEDASQVLTIYGLGEGVSPLAKLIDDANDKYRKKVQT